MRTFRCNCDNMLFFDNSECLRCGKETGYCPRCRKVVALLPQPGGNWHCGNEACGAALVKCANYEQHNVCNRCVIVSPTSEVEKADADSATAEGVLCDCCSMNQTIPDLSVTRNRVKWYRLESAKRRLLYDLDLLSLPYRLAEDDPRPRLRFDFKADYVVKHTFWRPMGKKERVFTGHANGLITINIREADEVERERLRVDLGEAHRTLIGHFRHEVAHWYWEILVAGQDEERCVSVFGDHNNPTYQEALDRHYETGAPADWQDSHVSAYATMHPWEDFAETFATYLDMVSVLDTAYHVGFMEAPPCLKDFVAMVSQYKSLGIGMNEINRSMGLLDLVPEVLTQPAREKLRYIHDLIAAATAANRESV